MALSNQSNHRFFVTRPKSLEKPGTVHDLIWRHWPPEGYRQQVARVLQNQPRGGKSKPQDTRTS
jgi:hypothetical protein